MQEVVGSTPILSTKITSHFRWDFLFAMFFIYIIYSSKWDKYYVGSCNDLEIRMLQHNGGRNISTKHGVPWVLKYSESFTTRAEAMQREKEIKNKKSRKYIEWLISSVG
jgi:putative endonuclease